jgi:hypothetical protein
LSVDKQGLGIHDGRKTDRATVIKSGSGRSGACGEVYNKTGRASRESTLQGGNHREPERGTVTPLLVAHRVPIVGVAVVLVEVPKRRPFHHRPALLASRRLAPAGQPARDGARQLEAGRLGTLRGLDAEPVECQLGHLQERLSLAGVKNGLVVDDQHRREVDYKGGGAAERTCRSRKCSGIRLGVWLARRRRPCPSQTGSWRLRSRVC